jgi:hypothetical protein
METIINGWLAFVRSDVFAGEYTEDGDRCEELSFYVVCEAANGARFASKVSYTTQDMGRDEAEGRAKAFCRRVEQCLRRGANPRRSAKWVPTWAAYGSAAWSERDALEAEARELEGEGSWQEANRFRQVHALVA